MKTSSLNFHQRAALFFQVSVRRIEIDFRNNAMPLTRGGFLRYFLEPVLTQLIQFTEGKIRWKSNDFSCAEVIEWYEMFQYFSTMLTTNTTPLSISKTVDLFKKYGAATPKISRMTWTLANYIAPTETGVLYTVFMRVNEEMRRDAFTVLNQVSTMVVTWAHQKDPSVPGFVPAKQRRSLRSRNSFRSSVNSHVISNGSFQPLKLFEHAVQSFYSKTKGRVDGATQYRAVL